MSPELIQQMLPLAVLLGVVILLARQLKNRERHIETLSKEVRLREALDRDNYASRIQSKAAVESEDFSQSELAKKLFKERTRHERSLTDHQKRRVRLARENRMRGEGLRQVLTPGDNTDAINRLGIPEESESASENEDGSTT